MRLFFSVVCLQDKVHERKRINLFTGMALSRIGLWMFDLAQLQILQESLESHPRRNRLTSFQYTLQVRHYGHR